MNRQAQAAVLFLTGAAVLHAGSTDLYLRYVKAGLQPLLLGAGVVLIVAAVATVWYEVRAGRSGRGMRWVRGMRGARSAQGDDRPEAERDDVQVEEAGAETATATGTTLGTAMAMRTGTGTGIVNRVSPGFSSCRCSP